MKRECIRMIAYILCVSVALVLVVVPVLLQALSSLPERYTSVHPASTVPPLMGFSRDSVFNKGSAKELDTLPGVGEVISQRIVEGRERWGDYRLPTDLLLVKGIGEKTLDKIMEALQETLVPLMPMGE